jgi:hypothetical protein
MQIEKITYGGWPNCYRVSNGEVELIVTSDVGPRILRYGFAGSQNLLKEYEETLGKSGEAEWQLRGGHRLWIAPEAAPLTYAPDNGPVHIEVRGDVLVATQPVEPSTGIEKKIIVKLARDSSRVEVIHQLRNTLAFPIELAPWALTMMEQGGVGITGFPPRGKHPDVLPPTHPLVMWAFSDLTDPRWTFTKKYMLLRQDPHNAEPTKLGLFNERTWGAYLLGTDLFIKRTDNDPAKVYPDRGCSFETFTRDDMLEIETLGHMQRVEPGRYAEHVERWSLHRNVRLKDFSEQEIDRVILPLI